MLLALFVGVVHFGAGLGSFPIKGFFINLYGVFYVKNPFIWNEHLVGHEAGFVRKKILQQRSRGIVLIDIRNAQRVVNQLQNRTKIGVGVR